MSVAADKPRRLGCVSRLLLLGIGVAAGAVPVYLLLPPTALQQVVDQVFPGRANLHDPDLLATWRGLVAAAAGVAVWLGLAVLVALGRRAMRGRGRPAATTTALDDLRRAAQGPDEQALNAACDRASRELTDDEVAQVVALVESGGLAEPARRRLAAWLYQYGRVTTAEIQLSPRR